MGTENEMTDEEKRRDQLTTAPDATEEDARPRIVVSEHDGVKRIDIAEDAPVRPGDPTAEPRES
ncbi:multidrug transporter [Microbacterium sp. JZ31]|uniref:multidrug transporter n=1 Tax=Microbacterium sp. JZ31 TaxID=1906274 RepID=UPI001931B3D7|nr:multidrug transporter [Microbacterium sp. JZ31]